MGDSEVDPVAEAKAIMTPKKVLIVLTSSTALPDGTPTGFYLTELTHAVMRWQAAGWKLDIASPLGCSQIDPSSLDDARSSGEKASIAWAENEESKAMLASHLKLADVAAREELDYDVLFFPGGYGPVFDLPENEDSKKLVVKLFETGKIVSAVCHGPAALVNVVLSDGSKLLAGKECTGFSNAEEEAVGKAAVVAKGSGMSPGSCQDAMVDGPIYVCAPPWEAKVCVAANLITGQNPASAAPLATEVLYALDPLRKKYEPLRNALLEERLPIVKELETKKEEFVIALGALKQNEAANADKIERLQMLSVATRDWLDGQLQTIDSKLERVAVQRQLEVDKYNKILAAAAAAAAAEE